MWIPILLTLFAFASVNAEIRDDLAKCERMLEDLGEPEDLADADLDDVCPKVLGAIDCMETAIEKETSLTLEQLGSLLEGRQAEVVTVAVNVISLIKDLCDTDSEIRKEYDEDAECFKKVNLLGDDDNIPCMEEAEGAIGMYEEIYNTVEQEPSEYSRQCMTTAYAVACSASVVKKTCGDRAFNTFRKIVKRTTIFKYGICSEQQMENLKTFALEHLDADGEDRELLQLAFDLKKRRK